MPAATTLIGSDVNVQLATAGTSTLVNQGTIIANDPGSTFRMVSNIMLDNQGTLQATSDGNLTVDNFVSNTGLITADADSVVTLAGNWTNDGILHAGAGGLITVNGNYTQSVIGTFNVDIGGTTISDFGRVQVTGLASLAGTLNVNLVNGFVPIVGDIFDILTFGSRSGDFDTKNGLSQAGVTFDPQFDLNSLTLVVIA